MGAIFYFGPFTLDTAACELRQGDRAVRIERRPMDLLVLLVQRRGQLVSRSDIVERLWDKDVFVDVDLSVNTAIRKVRQALEDDHRAPRYLETVSGRGYRFIAPVESASEGNLQAPAKRKTIAVLPFVNLGADPEQEYLSDGLTEEVIAAIGLMNPQQLAVIGRTSMARYKHTALSLAEIGRELGSDYLVEGSVRAEGDRLRITARLVAAAEQVQLWSGSYDSTRGSVLMLQRQLSEAIAEQVRLQLLPHGDSTLALRQSTSVEAYDLYLRGRFFWNQLRPASTRLALECYRRATQLDPAYALAWSGLADAYSSGPISGDARPLDVTPLAHQAAYNAVGAAPNLAETQISVGFLKLFLEWDWTSAEAAFRRATVLDPNYALGHRMLGVVLSHAGHHATALDALRRSRELDPLYAMHHALSALVAFHARDYDAAVQFGRQAIIIDPDFWIGYFQLARVYEHIGKTNAALEALTSAARLSGGNSKVLSLRGFIYATVGDEKQAHDLLATLTAISHERYVPPYSMALIHLGLGEIDAGIAHLEKGLSERDVHLIFLPVDPKWDKIRNDSRFQDLVKRCDFRAP